MVDFKIVTNRFKGIGIIVGGEKQIRFGRDNAVLQRKLFNLGFWHNADQASTMVPMVFEAAWMS